MSDWGIRKVNKLTFFTTQDKVREKVMTEEERVMEEKIKKDKKITENIETTLEVWCPIL